MLLSSYLKRAGGVGLIGILDRICGVFLGILLARWLGADGYGVYAFVMAIVVLLLIPAEFGLPDWLMRHTARNGGRSDVRLQRKVLQLVAFFGCSIAAISSLVVATFAADPAVATALIAGLWILPFRGLLNAVGFVLRGLGRARLAQIVHVLLPTLLALLVTGSAIFTGVPIKEPTFALGLRVIAVATALCAGFALLQSVQSKPPKDLQLDIGLSTLLRAAFPFLLIGATTRLLSRTDVIMLGLLLGTREAGIYHIALQGALVVQFAMNISNTITTPEFARLHAGGDPLLLQAHARMSARVVLVIGVPVAALMIWFGEDLLIALFGTEFQGAATPLAVLAAGYMASFLFGAPGFLLNMTGHEKTAFRIYAVIAVGNVVLNASLIPILGMMGAALATSIALIAQNLLLWQAARRELGMSCAIV